MPTLFLARTSRVIPIFFFRKWLNRACQIDGKEVLETNCYFVLIDDDDSPFKINCCCYGYFQSVAAWLSKLNWQSILSAKYFYHLTSTHSEHRSRLSTLSPYPNKAKVTCRIIQKHSHLIIHFTFCHVIATNFNILFGILCDRCSDRLLIFFQRKKSQHNPNCLCVKISLLPKPDKWLWHFYQQLLLLSICNKVGVGGFPALTSCKSSNHWLSDLFLDLY